MSDMVLFEDVVFALTPDLPEDEWLAGGEILRQADRDVPWILGDWINHGIDTYHDGLDQAVKLLAHLSHSAVSRHAFVARRFPADRRRDISFWQHSECAALPPAHADLILDRAVNDRLSQQDVRNLAQAAKAELKGRMPELDSDRLRREKQETQRGYFRQYHDLFPAIENTSDDWVRVPRDMFLALSSRIPKPKPTVIDVL